MPNLRPGRRSNTFEQRCVKSMVSEVCGCIGEDMLVDKCRGCYVWGREFMKSGDDFIGINDSEISIYWPSCEHRNVDCGSEVIRLGKRYTVKNGFPRNLHNGWKCAELEYCGLC